MKPTAQQENDSMDLDPERCRAARLGVGERYLRKLFEREVGASPLAVAQNQRLLFAKKLLAETALPVGPRTWPWRGAPGVPTRPIYSGGV